ncbi:MAG: response regulator transcription factor [Synergistaceae bacterium]|nr:response regulator transcription factor [Synergistaceae bacterium]
MYKILIVDSGAIDRRMMRELLENRFGSAISVFISDERADAAEAVGADGVDLLIVNVPYHSAGSDYADLLIHSAFNINKNLSLIITSVKNEERIAGMATRFNADGYLLKPYRREQLLSLVENVMAQRGAKTGSGPEPDSAAEEGTLMQYLKKLEDSIHECDYKKSKNMAKEYISLVYSDRSVKNIRNGMINFARSVAEIGRWYGNDELQKKLEECLERFMKNYNIQVRRFESSEAIEEMIDFIFVEMEKFTLSAGDEIKKALNYIEQNIKNGITLDSTAEHINMSPSYFSKVFKKATGTNFIVYVTDRRVEIAKELLRSTDMSIINIACELSYNETNYFSKVFKKKVGLSPTEYRQRFGGER